MKTNKTKKTAIFAKTSKSTAFMKKPFTAFLITLAVFTAGTAKGTALPVDSIHADFREFSENMIARGEYPVLIDLETLIPLQSQSITRNEVFDSVLKSGDRKSVV